MTLLLLALSLRLVLFAAGTYAAGAIGDRRATAWSAPLPRCA